MKLSEPTNDPEFKAKKNAAEELRKKSDRLKREIAIASAADRSRLERGIAAIDAEIEKIIRF